LARVDGDVALLKEVINMFFSDCAKLMPEIREAVTRHDSKMLAWSAHAFKGSVGNFTTKVAFEAALRLETMGRNGDLAGAEEACAVLEEEVERLKSSLAELTKEEIV
jgi:HPt (histidine-containing phosphotransfer) domain-containing protein